MMVIKYSSFQPTQKGATPGCCVVSTDVQGSAGLCVMTNVVTPFVVSKNSRLYKAYVDFLST